MDDLVVRDRQDEVLAVGVDHRERHLVVVVLAVDGLVLDVLQGVVHPAHVPLETEAEAAVVVDDERCRERDLALHPRGALLEIDHRGVPVLSDARGVVAGPSGVGKTELSRTLASFLFGDADALIQLDMSEYSEKHTASRLFGAPPGYVGYDEGGQLTEKVRRRPFSVVLFDEIEKAHPDIFNSLLQVLEDGRLTDAQGRTVDFKNTIIIMTTNLGTRDISKSLGLGFANSDDDLTNYERMKGKVGEELKNHFRPEFLNRIDDVIVFHQLTQEQIIQIVDLMIASLDERLRAKDMGIELTKAAKDLLAKKGYDPLLGARPLRRTIQRDIEDPISERILFGELSDGEIILVDAKDDEFTFVGNAKANTPDSPEDLAQTPSA